MSRSVTPLLRLRRRRAALLCAMRRTRSLALPRRPTVPVVVGVAGGRPVVGVAGGRPADGVAGAVRFALRASTRTPACGELLVKACACERAHSREAYTLDELALCRINFEHYVYDRAVGQCCRQDK